MYLVSRKATGRRAELGNLIIEDKDTKKMSTNLHIINRPKYLFSQKIC